MSAHPFDWYVSQVDVARWNDETPGKRDAHVSCPSCGSADNLHLSERDGGLGVLHCFTDGDSDADVYAAFEAIDSAPVRLNRKRKSIAPERSEVGRETFIYGSATKTRVNYSDDTKSFFWDPKGTKPDGLLYGSEDVASFDREQPVVLVEGERKREALKTAGVQSVSSAGGSSWKPTATALEPLQGLDVVLWPDNDNPGRSLMDRVARNLQGIASSVRLVEWTDAPPKGDAADFLAAKGDLDALLAEAQPWRSGLSRQLSEIERQDPEPLVDRFAHPTAHTILYGPNGKGKGVFAAWKIAARTKAGEVVLILDYEGHLGEWRSRLEDLGADLDRVHIALPLGLEDGLLKGAIWDQTEDIRAEADFVAADWLYVDSVSAACGVADVTDAFAPGPYFAALNAIGRPSVSLGHVTKAEDLKYPFGSMLWRAYVRMAWSFSGEGDVRELVNRKTNDYGDQPSLTFDWSWVSQHGPRSVPATLDAMTSHVSVEARAWEAIGEDEIGLAAILERVNDDGREAVVEKTIRNKLSGSARFEQRTRGLWRRVPPVQLNAISSRARAGATQNRPIAGDELGTKAGTTSES